MRKIVLLTLLATTVWAEDRVELDQARIEGNEENPNVMYVMPWRSSKGGELRGLMLESLYREMFQPIDRQAFLESVEKKYKDEQQ